jgi:hypothetical protein
LKLPSPPSTPWPKSCSFHYREKKSLFPPWGDPRGNATKIPSEFDAKANPFWRTSGAQLSIIKCTDAGRRRFANQASVDRIIDLPSRMQNRRPLICHRRSRFDLHGVNDMESSLHRSL